MVKINYNESAALLASVPPLIGFTPENSLVCDGERVHGLQGPSSKPEWELEAALAWQQRALLMAKTSGHHPSW